MSNQFSISSFIAISDNQKKVNRIYITVFFLIITLNVLIAAYSYLLKEPLFFFTCDAFELFLAGSVAYLVMYKILPHKSIGIKIVTFISILLFFLGLAFLKLYRRGIPFDAWSRSNFTDYVGLIFIFTSLFYILKNLNLLINNSYLKTKQALEEAELLLLRQQFNPHFLYNAFNSLYSMSIKKHPNTSDSILKLSGMMRYLTDDASVSGTLLKHEIKFIEDYLEIEKIRFGNDANISFKLNGALKGQLIEPLLMINLVENAFKHGFYTNNDSAFVNIDAQLSEDHLIFKIRNSVFKKQHFQESDRVGKGLHNLRKRLDLSYGQDASLNIEEKKNEFIATLNIKFKA